MFFPLKGQFDLFYCLKKNNFVITDLKFVLPVLNPLYWEDIFLTLQELNAPLLNLMPQLQTLVPPACKQGIKSKAGTIKGYKERKTTTAPPNE